MISSLPVFITMLMIYCATKCRSRPLMRIVDFRRLEGDGFNLGHKNLFELGFYALFMSAVSAACVWAWLSYARAAHEGFVKTEGKIQVCNLHRNYETYHGRMTEHVSARFEYVYEVNGSFFRKSDFAYWSWRHGQHFDLPVATGKTVTVHYNPANPRQSYVKKANPSPFRSWACIAFCLSGAFAFCWLVANWEDVRSACVRNSKKKRKKDKKGRQL